MHPTVFNVFPLHGGERVQAPIHSAEFLFGDTEKHLQGIGAFTSLKAHVSASPRREKVFNICEQMFGPARA